MSKCHKVNLPNGARLYYVKNKITNVTYTQLSFRCGASCDTIPGIAHFCEHSFFLGTDKYTKQELNEQEEKFGFFNASTSYRRICFHAEVSNKDEEKVLQHLEHMINHSTFATDLVEKEKDVICQEITSKADNFRSKMSYLNLSNLSTHKLFKDTILGSEKTVRSITSKDLLAFKDKYFVSNNLEVLIISPLPLHKIKKMVVKNLSSKLPVAKDFEQLPMSFYDVDNENGYIVKNENINKNYIRINFVVDRGDLESNTEWRFKTYLLLEYLNSNDVGVIRDLRHKKDLVYGAGFSLTMLKDKSVISFSTECVKDNVNEVIKTVAEYVQELVKNGLDKESFENVRNKQEYYRQAEEPRISRLFDQLTDFLYYGKVLNRKKYLNILKKAKLEEINSILKEVFAKPRVGLTIMGDIDKKEVITKANFNKLFK